MASEIISQYLDVDGDGGGSTDAAVDGSSTPVVFKFLPTRRCHIARMMVYIRDGGSIVAAGYGAIGGGLTNGITVVGGGVNLHGQITVKSNADWARVCYDVTYNTFGAGDNFVHCRWTFEKSGIPLILDAGDSLAVTVSDDCSSLVEHLFNIQGRYT